MREPYRFLIGHNGKEFYKKITFPYDGDPLVEQGAEYSVLMSDGASYAGIRFFHRDGRYEDFIMPVVCPGWAVAYHLISPHKVNEGR